MSVGKKESKRRSRAMPSAEGGMGLVAGCINVVAAAVVVLLAAYVLSESPTWWRMAQCGMIVLAVLFAYLLRSAVVLSSTSIGLARRGVRYIVVYSRRARTARYIESEWLPRLGDAAVVLDWTERKTWGHSPESRLYKRYCASSLNYAPAVLVVRWLQRPLVYRFYYAFLEMEKGRSQYLQQMESEMFGAARVRPQIQRS